MGRLLRAFAPRWRKVLRDLTLSKGRTLMVVLSIAVGVFAIGTVAGTRGRLATALDRSFKAIQPSSATITTFSSFDESLVQTVDRMPEVGLAEGRRSIFVRVRAPDGAWRNMQLNVLPKGGETRLDRVLPHEGAWPPPRRGLVVERSAMGLVGAAIGDTVTLRTPRGKERQLRLVGTAFDVYALIFTIDGTPWGYIDEDTLAWLGEGRGVNELHLTAAQRADDAAHVAQVVAAVRDKLERDGRAIYYMTIPEPGKHPLDSTIQAMLLLLGAMGALALGLSGFLVANTTAAILAQETRNIGIMKAIGAGRGQIAGIYAALVLAYGLLSLGLALPLGVLGTWGLSRLMAGYLNLDLSGGLLSPRVLGLQAVVSLLVPLLAALLPIGLGVRTTVREALGSYGLGRGRFGRRRLDRALEGLRGLSRPLLLGLRNTFRRPGRLSLTVLTLTIAGAMFIAVLHVRASLGSTMDRLLQLYQYDVAIQLARPYRVDRLKAVAARVPGIKEAEGWGFTTARHLGAQEGPGASMLSFSVPLIVFAPPASSRMLSVPILRGRWLLPQDERAAVVSTKVLDDQPGLDLGGTLRLKLEGKETAFTVVGVSQGLGPSALVYVNYGPFSRLAEAAGQAQWLSLTLSEASPEARQRAAQALEAAFERAGLSISLVIKIDEERREALAAFDGIIALLLAMVGLMAVVGGLGLAGSTSLNVIERTREIGVLRAIGAGNGDIYRVILVENLCVAFLSWTLGLLLSLPLGWLLGQGIGQALLGNPLNFAVSLGGIGLWLALVTVLVLLASWLPARRATRLEVREALAYGG